MTKYLQNNYSHIWVHTKDGFITGLLKQDAMLAISQEIFEKAKDGSFYLMWNEWKVISNEISRLSYEISKLDLLSLDNQTLWQWYEKIFDIDQKMWDISIYIDALDI